MNRFNARDEEVTMRHHELALAAFVASVAGDPDVRGVLLVGSVARGIEREDSDVDVYVVVSDARWDRAVRGNRVMYVDRRDADYPGGYLDVKLIGRTMLQRAADTADEPLRASLEGARIALGRDEDLAELVARAAQPGSTDWRERVLTQLAQVRLHAGYFLAGAEREGDALLARSAATHALLAAHRALLAHAHRLHRGPKYLAGAVAALPERPADWSDIVARLLAEPTADDGRRLIAVLDEHLDTGGEPPIDDDAALSRFVLDNEYAWSTRIPVPEYR